MQTYEYKMLHDWLIRVEERLDQLEANRPKAESDAAACSPAVGQKSLPRSPDRETLAEVKTWMQDLRVRTKMQMGCGERRSGWLECYEAVIQHLDKLDQGPIAESLSTSDGHKSVKDYIDSLTVY